MAGRHHRGNYPAMARAIRDAANANPTTRCWRCGRTLDQHPTHRNGKPAQWTAGHINDGQVDGPLAPEVSTCNYSAGAALGNERMRTREVNASRDWLAGPA